MNEPTVVSNSRTLPVKSSDSDAHETTGDWFADYSDRHGRPPRILHIGNIANNAYLNAHLLNEAGYDCDVLCYDYYHIMACPEWEDADFVGTIDSQNHPDWRTVDLKGFRRPRWFAQGPFDLAVLYLIARRNDRPLVTWMLWQILCALTRLPYYRPGGLFNPVAACFWRACGFLLRCVYVGARINPEVRPTPKRQDRLSRATTLVDRLAIRTANYLISIVKILLLPLWCLNLLVERTITTVVFCSAPMWHVRWWRYWTAGLRERIASIVRKTPVDPNSQEKRRSADELIECFRGLFPDRNDALDVTDFEVHKAMHPLLKELLPRYDIVQGYGTDPVLPMLVGKRPYIAFEHGTIRQIPFEDSSIGRLSALAYRLATGVVITNCDNRTAADRLGIENYRFVPHPIREKHLIHGVGRELRDKLIKNLNSDFLIFHPARHDWSTDPSADIKGNHKLIDALCRFFVEIAPRGRALFVEWGGCVPASKQRIDQFGMQNNFRWLAPVGGIRMAEYIDACDVTADQFHLGAFGAIVPKGLALGKPVLGYVEPEMHTWCFSELPPVVNARNSDEIFESLVRLYRDTSYRETLAELGPSWYHAYHSEAVVQDRLAAYYADVCRQQASLTSLVEDSAMRSKQN